MSIHDAPAYDQETTASLRLLRIDDVAELLAISRDSVYRLVRSGALPRVRVGKRTRFRVTDVRAYLDREAAP